MTKRGQYPWEFQGEILTLETPEQTLVEYRVAAFGTRMIAALLDRLIIWSIVIVLIVLVIAMGLAGGLGEGSMPYVIAAVIIAQFLITLFYYAVAEVRGEGQTWGKQRLGIRTVMATGRGVTVGASLLRNLARVADDVPVFWLVPALSTGKRRIGDLLAGTFVVVDARTTTRKTRRRDWLEKLAPNYRALEDRHFPFTAQTAKRLHEDDLNLIEYLDERVHNMPPGRQRRLLTEIATKYAERLELEGDRERIAADPRRFLQELGLFLRDRFEERPV